MNNKNVLFEYEQLLLGKKKIISPYFFSYNDENNEKTALIIIRYAVEKYLKWTPEEVRNWLNRDIIKVMKLDGVVNQIRFPGEFNPNKDFFYIAHLLYPGIIKFNKKELILRIYKQVLDRELHKFPKNYISGNEGVVRASVCLQYMLTQFFQFSSIEEIYQFFTTPDGLKALKDYRLYTICYDLFGSPLDFLHESLAPQQKNEFYYHYYRFLTADSKQILSYKKEGCYVK